MNDQLICNIIMMQNSEEFLNKYKETIVNTNFNNIVNILKYFEIEIKHVFINDKNNITESITIVKPLNIIIQKFVQTLKKASANLKLIYKCDYCNYNKNIDENIIKNVDDIIIKNIIDNFIIKSKVFECECNEIIKNVNSINNVTNNYKYLCELQIVPYFKYDEQPMFYIDNALVPVIIYLI
jgi:hypothetical protein